jgi:hypothetical protein
MTDLNSFFKVDLIDSVVAADINKFIAATIRPEYSNAETLSATRTLLDADTPIQKLNCNGANRIVKLPAYNAANHSFVIVNSTSSGGWTLTVQSNDGTITYNVLTPNASCFVLPDGVEYIVSNNFDSTDPTDISATAAAGTSLVAARRDHTHKRKTKIITATRTMNAASGNVSYTGVGFKPTKITAQANITGTFSASNGVCNGTQMQAQYTFTSSVYNDITSNYVVFIYGVTGGVDYQVASIVSMDADGFTLAWTKAGTDTATINISFFCET